MGGKHLWIVVAVNESDFDTAIYVVLVNVTSTAPGGDTSCVLERGDHEFISHRSYVYYGAIQEREPSEIAHLEVQPPCSADLLKRIREGLHRSRFTRRGFKDKVPKV
jgi:hypothetical protein